MPAPPIRQRTNILTSPAFLAALSLLLINDFILKETFHNWLTGKLSDFSGLFVFAAFFSSAGPRLSMHIHVATAIAFVIWKSPYSQPIIDAVNTWGLFKIGRSVDFTDLFALCVLPISAMYTSRRLVPPQARPTKRWRSVAVSAICIFAFAATSYLPPEHVVRYQKDYEFNESLETLGKQLLDLELRAAENRSAGVYIVFLNDAICPDSFTGVAEVRISPLAERKSRLRLEAVRYHCEAKVPGDSNKLLMEFEALIVEKLRSSEK